MLYSTNQRLCTILRYAGTCCVRVTNQPVISGDQYQTQRPQHVGRKRGRAGHMGKK